MLAPPARRHQLPQLRALLLHGERGRHHHGYRQRRAVPPLRAGPDQHLPLPRRRAHVCRGPQRRLHLRVRRPRRPARDGRRHPQDEAGRLLLERGPELVRLRALGLRRGGRQHRDRAQRDLDEVPPLRDPRRCGRHVPHGLRGARPAPVQGRLGCRLCVLGLRDLDAVGRKERGQVHAGETGHLHQAEADLRVLQRREVRAPRGQQELRLRRGEL
mmetsp:Transcript_67290/g.197546  ORF Transcript_67290/g.197546 Transcript_67290/m.197546 type:complete len:215 (-) Transcript_67290:686-1330(-)